MCMHIEIASIIFEICIVPEPATTSGTGLLLDRDTGMDLGEPWRTGPRTGVNRVSAGMNRGPAWALPG